MTGNEYGMEVLSRADCLRLLGRADIGRIAVTMGALPVVLPVNFALFDGDILFRIGRGTKLDAAATDAVVAFEIDGIEPSDDAAWSVLVQGIAHDITDKTELARAKAIPLRPWIGPDDHYLRVSTSIVAGRRVTTGAQAGWARLADAEAR